jgi:hypothetical protein
VTGEKNRLSRYRQQQPGSAIDEFGGGVGRRAAWPVSSWRLKRTEARAQWSE